VAIAERGPDQRISWSRGWARAATDDVGEQRWPVEGRLVARHARPSYQDRSILCARFNRDHTSELAEPARRVIRGEHETGCTCPCRRDALWSLTSRARRTGEGQAESKGAAAEARTEPAAGKCGRQGRDDLDEGVG